MVGSACVPHLAASSRQLWIVSYLGSLPRVLAAPLTRTLPGGPPDGRWGVRVPRTALTAGTGGRGDPLRPLDVEGRHEAEAPHRHSRGRRSGVREERIGATPTARREEGRITERRIIEGLGRTGLTDDDGAADLRFAIVKARPAHRARLIWGDA